MVNSISALNSYHGYLSAAERFDTVYWDLDGLICPPLDLEAIEIPYASPKYTFGFVNHPVV